MRRKPEKKSGRDSRTVNVTLDAGMLGRAERIAESRGVRLTEWLRRVIGEEVIRIETREERGAA